MVGYYYRCYACGGCTFKPKTLNRKQLEKREGCICVCHWGERYSLGITIEEARLLVSRTTKQKIGDTK